MNYSIRLLNDSQVRHERYGNIIMTSTTKHISSIGSDELENYEATSSIHMQN